MWLFGSLWDRWEIAFKVATPLLHIAFSATQIHGSLVFWRMYKKQQRYLREEDESSEVKEEDIGLPTDEPVPPLKLILSGAEPKCPPYS